MRTVTPIILAALSFLVGCASHPQSASAVKRSIDAVVTDENQHEKVVQALQAGEKPADALAKASDGPKDQKPVPH